MVDLEWLAKAGRGELHQELFKQHKDRFSQSMYIDLVDYFVKGETVKKMLKARGVHPRYFSLLRERLQVGHVRLLTFEFWRRWHQQHPKNTRQ